MGPVPWSAGVGQNRRFELAAQFCRKRTYVYRFQPGPCTAHGSRSPRRSRQRWGATSASWRAISGRTSCAALAV